SRSGDDMRLTTPRIAPTPAENWTDEQREIVEPMLARGSVLNIFRTLLIHPTAARAFLIWGGYILSRKSTLASRQPDRGGDRAHQDRRRGAWLERFRCGAASGDRRFASRAVHHRTGLG